MPPVWDGKAYAKHRPTYPNQLYDAIFEFAGDNAPQQLAVDLGCGSGQVTCSLAEHYVQVVGLDPSQTQLSNAASRTNVEYRLGTAENTGLPDGSVDLVTAAAALHWFDRPAFYAEARRVLRPGGALAAWSYPAMPRFGNEAAQAVYLRLRLSFWEYSDARIQAVMTHGYAGFEPGPSDFALVQRRQIEMQWPTSVASLAGWVRSWSGFNAFVQEHGQHKADELLDRFEADMRAAMGVPDRSTPITAVLPLDVVLAKGPLPVT